MDAVARSRRLLLIVLAASAPALVGLGAACGGTHGAGTPVGVSTALPGSTGTWRGKDGGAGRVVLPADFRTGFVKTNHARFVSNGHAAGRYQVDVYENAAAHGSPANADFPVGSRWIEEHFEVDPADGGASAGPVMMIEKMAKGFDAAHGDFRYVVVTRGGDVALDGTSESCAGCHDDAPHDHVFHVE